MKTRREAGFFACRLGLHEFQFQIRAPGGLFSGENTSCSYGKRAVRDVVEFELCGKVPILITENFSQTGTAVRNKNVDVGSGFASTDDIAYVIVVSANYAAVGWGLK